MENKLRVGFISNSPLIKTGLARNIKALLPILYKTNKYDIFLLNQSISDNEPNFQRFPWHNEGCMKNFNQEAFNKDGNYARFVSYGNSAVEDWVVRNKLDVVLALDNPWAFDLNAYINSDWYKHIKDNFIFGITLDSEPILPHAKELAKNCPNFKSWSGFAVRRLQEEDSKTYAHVGILRGSIDSEQFKPLTKKEILDLRHKFNILDNEKIIIYLGRNQLRKNAFYANQEALALWKQKNPDKKIRLLFHTKISEPGGWPIEQIRDELKLDKTDILCTYFCRNCQDWVVEPFSGEDLNCSHCGGNKSRITAGIDSTITEEDLNKIYNISDAACSVFTSGGQEYFNVESMLSGIPLASPSYSSGEDFVLSGLVKEITGHFTREHNTSFKKFVPNINSIVDFYDYIWNLKDEDREILVKKAREWAVNEFDAKNISNQIQQFIDTRKKIDWEPYANRKKDIKDINAQIEDKQTDDEFVRHCYLKILNMTIDDKDSGYQHWMKFLTQQQDKRKLREELVKCFRNAALEHNRKVQPQIPFNSLLLDNKKKHFLIVCPESAGDCLYVSSTLKSFKESYPENEWNIYMATKPEFMELFDCNPYIDKLLPYQDFMQSEIHCLGRGNEKGIFQGFCYITAMSQKFLSYLGNHNINLKLN